MTELHFWVDCSPKENLAYVTSLSSLALLQQIHRKHLLYTSSLQRFRTHTHSSLINTLYIRQSIVQIKVNALTACDDQTKMRDKNEALDESEKSHTDRAGLLNNNEASVNLNMYL